MKVIYSLFISIFLIHSFVGKCSGSDRVVYDTFIEAATKKIMNFYPNDSILQVYFVKSQKKIAFEGVELFFNKSYVYLFRIVLPDSLEHWYAVYDIEKDYNLNSTIHIASVGGQDTINASQTYLIRKLVEEKIILNKGLGIKSTIFCRRRQLLNHLSELRKPIVRKIVL